MLLRIAVLTLCIALCLGFPAPADPAVSSALSAAGIPDDKFHCDCHKIPDVNGVETIRCHCWPRPPSSAHGQGGGGGEEGGAKASGATLAPGGEGEGSGGGTTPSGGGGGGSTAEGAVATFAPPKNCPNKDPGGEQVYVSCQKRSTKADWTTEPAHEYVKTSGGYDLWIKGKWTKVKCGTEGITDTFVVAPGTYNDALQKCEDLGYQLVQPVYTKLSTGWYAFEICGIIQPHFRKVWYGFMKLGTAYSRQERIAEDKC